MTRVRANLKSRTAAFSLIEIVLAVGIVSFALVGILGLFPVALDSAAASQDATQASFIAEEIFSGLKASASFVPDSTDREKGHSIDLSNPGPSQSFFYDANGFVVDSGNNLAAYEAEVIFNADSPIDGLTRTEVVVYTPIDQKTNPNVNHFSFIALLRQPRP